MHRFLAFDLGAESGRAVVGTFQDERISLEEIGRFPNEPVEVCETLHWDVLALYNHLLKGMREYVGRFGAEVDGIGIDTWGLDFGLLSADGKLLQNPVHYRDRRTEGMLEEVRRRISPQEIFHRTGIPLARHHTVCQLLSLCLNSRPLLDSATTLLMMADLLNYFLTGQMRCERTLAIGSQLYDPWESKWSEEVFRKLDLPLHTMPPLTDPGTMLGELCDSAKHAVGLQRAPVIVPCTHDTGSAVAAVPGAGENWAFLCLGTWSVAGTLTPKVITSPEALAVGVCNELTLQSLFLCRNIMGLWLLQQARAVWAQRGEKYSYEDLVRLAQAAPSGGPMVWPDDPSFLAPKDMTQAIDEYCVRTRQRKPQGPGELARCIFESLALSYRHAFEALAKLVGHGFSIVHAVGGGTRNSLLCQLTADATGLAVVAGPQEATVLGNVLVQALARGSLASAAEVREVARASSDLITFEPRDSARWGDGYERFTGLIQQAAG